MTRLFRRPLSSTLPLLLLAGLFLSACGSSDGGGGNVSSVGWTPTSASAAAPPARATARSTRLPQSVKYQC